MMLFFQEPVFAVQPAVRGRVVSDTGVPFGNRVVKWEDCRGATATCISETRHAITDADGYFEFPGWLDLSEAPDAQEGETVREYESTHYYSRGSWGFYYASTNIAGHFGCGENNHTFSVQYNPSLPFVCSSENFNLSNGTMTQIQNNSGEIDLGDLICTPPGGGGPTPTPSPSASPTPTPTPSPSPTPTPTPYAPRPWYKLNNSSLHKKSNLNIYVPASSTHFDSTDTADGFFITGNAGVTSAHGIISIDTPSGHMSASNLRISTAYTAAGHINPSTFLTYAQGNKKVRTITSLSQIVSGSDEIFVLTTASGGWLETHSGNRLPAGTYVLIINGNLRFRNDAYTVGNPGSNIGLLVTGQVQVHSSYSEINAILVGDSFNLSYDTNLSTTPLKIRGNIISSNAVDIETRQRTDMSKPSFYVQFDPSTYINLLPLLSTTHLEGRVIQ